jgi:hypothetical protein
LALFELESRRMDRFAPPALDSWIVSSSCDEADWMVKPTGVRWQAGGLMEAAVALEN